MRRNASRSPSLCRFVILARRYRLHFVTGGRKEVDIDKEVIDLVFEVVEMFSESLFFVHLDIDMLFASFCLWTTGYNIDAMDL